MILKTPKLTKVSGDEKVYFCGCPLIGAGVQNKREGGKEGGSEPARPRAAGATVGSGRPPRCPEVTAALPGCAAPAGQPEGPGGPFCTFAGVRAARRGPLRLLFPTKSSKILFNEPQFLAGTY